MKFSAGYKKTPSLPPKILKFRSKTAPKNPGTTQLSRYQTVKTCNLQVNGKILWFLNLEKRNITSKFTLGLLNAYKLKYVYRNINGNNNKDGNFLEMKESCKTDAEFSFK